jgi:uncharacterized protein (DUF433 family)
MTVQHLGDIDLTSSAALWIDPARRSGEVCVYGTRITVDMVADFVWSGCGPELIEDGYGVDRRQALCACWWYATQHPRTKIGLAWAGWAGEAHEILWRSDSLLPDWPPAEAG